MYRIALVKTTERKKNGKVYKPPRATIKTDNALL